MRQSTSGHVGLAAVAPVAMALGSGSLDFDTVSVEGSKHFAHIQLGRAHASVGVVDELTRTWVRLSRLS